MILFQVDVYPSSLLVSESATSSSQTASLLLSPAQTLYCCPLSTRSSKGLTVGRQPTSDISLLVDKSVSRQHCRLFIRKEKEDASGSSNPTTSKNDDGECVVLETMGKSGCYVIRTRDNEKEDANNNKKKEKSNNDDEETDDDDDDLQIASSIPTAQSQGILAAIRLSSIAQQLTRHKKVTIEAVTANQSVVLTELSSSSDNDDQHHDHNNDTPALILQCGKLGSTLVFYRKSPMIVSCSRKDKQLWMLPNDDAVTAKLRDMGARFEPVLGPNTTHYVCTTRNASPSQLAAWSYGCHFVHPDYFVASRTDPVVGWPPSHIHYPPKALDHLDFWNTKADSQLWRDWTYVQVNPHDELETLVRAAGASVVNLHSRTLAEEGNQEEEEDGETLLARVQQILVEQHVSTPNYVFYTTDAAAKDTNAKRLLAALQQVRSDAVACTARSLAKHLTRQLLPNGQEKGKAKPVSQQRRARAIQETSHEQRATTSNELDAAACATSSGGTDTTNPQLEQDGAVVAPAASRGDNESPLSNNTLSTLKDISEVPTPDDDKEQDLKRKRSADELLLSTDGSSQNLPSKRSKASVSEDGNDDADDRTKRHLKQIGKANLGLSGWLEIAPKQRKAFVRPKHDIKQTPGVSSDNEEEADDIVIMNVAPTDRCKGLIVVAPTDLTKMSTTKGTRSISSGRPNFKAFRKNAIRSNPVKTTFAMIVADLPSDGSISGARRREVLQEMEGELEAQQHQSDALWQDPSATHRRVRRR